MPRDVASRAAKEVCDEGRGVGPGGYGVYLDFRDAIERLGLDQIREKYGNLFEIYERITGEDAYQVPMRIYPAVHYTMGGLWVDYHLMSNHPGTLRRRRGQFLGPGGQPPGGQRPHAGPGRRLLHPAVHRAQLPGLDEAGEGRHHATPRSARPRPRSSGRIDALLKTQGPAHGRQPPPRAGHGSMWDDCGMTRSEASLRHALGKIPELREEFRTNVRVLGTGEELNQSLEKAGRVADFLELAELMCIDALHRSESCGGHYPRGEPNSGGRGPAR